MEPILRTPSGKRPVTPLRRSIVRTATRPLRSARGSTRSTPNTHGSPVQARSSSDVRNLVKWNAALDGGKILSRLAPRLRVRYHETKVAQTGTARSRTAASARTRRRRTPAFPTTVCRSSSPPTMARSITIRPCRPSTTYSYRRKRVAQLQRRPPPLPKDPRDPTLRRVVARLRRKRIGCRRATSPNWLPSRSLLPDRTC